MFIITRPDPATVYICKTTVNFYRGSKSTQPKAITSRVVLGLRTIRNTETFTIHEKRLSYCWCSVRL